MYYSQERKLKILTNMLSYLIMVSVGCDKETPLCEIRWFLEDMYNVIKPS